MTVDITEYPNISEQAVKLGCRVPAGIAILPLNFVSASTREELLLDSTAATIHKLLKNNNFELDSFLSPGERLPAVHNKHFEWAPLLFISASLLTENPNAVSVALGIISNYATDFFKGLPDKRVTLNLVIENKKDRSCKRLNYEGDVAGLTSLPEIIRSMNDT
jgi:hypothetical protein